jgi:SAM-dependent methyltransferase
MDKATDWASLWREIVEAHARGREAAGHAKEEDFWRAKARDFDDAIRRRWTRPDSIRDFLAARLDADCTVLDIGAGTGAWAALMARRSNKVTAIEPSSAMIQVLRERIDSGGIRNVEIVRGYWPEVDVEPHDYSFCSHAMYGIADLRSFIRRMEDLTRRECWLLMRAPLLDSVMAEAAMLVWGQPHDSANMVVAFNVLVQMGIHPNVLMEESDPWEPWTHPTLEEALGEIKWRLDVVGSKEYDDSLAAMLRRRLKYRDGRYEWPPATRSALLYWPALRNRQST